MSDASYPSDLLYHPEHDWAQVKDDVATFGITWYAQDSLGDVVFFEAPSIGTQVQQGQTYTDVYAPLSGEIVEVNEALADSPETINEDPYGAGWLVKVKLADPSEQKSLLDAAAYQGLLA